ncbi:hypothetical protein FB451DRAFT_1187877 [Mycena latifolia]|nr:hypothetical protein FB451DRAFT_1187877 [Mycena latifolia]
MTRALLYYLESTSTVSGDSHPCIDFWQAARFTLCYGTSSGRHIDELSNRPSASCKGGGRTLKVRSDHLTEEASRGGDALFDGPSTPMKFDACVVGAIAHDLPFSGNWPLCAYLPRDSSKRTTSTRLYYSVHWEPIQATYRLDGPGSYYKKISALALQGLPFDSGSSLSCDQYVSVSLSPNLVFQIKVKCPPTHLNISHGNPSPRRKFGRRGDTMQGEAPTTAYMQGSICVREDIRLEPRCPGVNAVDNAESLSQRRTREETRRRGWLGKDTEC